MSTANGVREVLFYNHAGFGDLHLSRGLVRKVSAWLQKQGVDVAYAHNRGADVLADIPAVRYAPAEHERIDPYGPSFRDGNRVGINTWYCTDNGRFSSHYGLTYDCLYSVIEHACCEHLQMNLAELEPEPANMLPWIDYTAFPGALEICKPLAAETRTRVLVCNSVPMSSQSDTDDMDALVAPLADRYPGALFICTNGTALARDNVVDVKQWLDKPGCNLNELSALGLLCDVIVGRASGPYTFCYTREQFFNTRARLVSFSTLSDRPRWLGSRFENQITYSCSMIDHGTRMGTGGRIAAVGREIDACPTR